MRNGSKWLLWTAISGAVLLVGPRLLFFRRRRLPPGFVSAKLSRGDGSQLACANHRTGSDRLVIVAHGLMDASCRPGYVRLASAASERFDVISYDMAGHGDSSGAWRFSFLDAANELGRVVEHARSLGYRKIGVAGYSMGGAAAIVAAAQGAPIDAVAAVSSPVRPLAAARRLGGLHAMGVACLWARMMGTRVDPCVAPEPWPIDYVADVSPRPLLVVHNALDFMISRRQSEALYAVAKQPKAYARMPGALHASQRASQNTVLDWLDAQL